jgi:hypothetical protein
VLQQGCSHIDAKAGRLQRPALPKHSPRIRTPGISMSHRQGGVRIFDLAWQLNLLSHHHHHHVTN